MEYVLTLLALRRQILFERYLNSVGKFLMSEELYISFAPGDQENIQILGVRQNSS